MAKRGPAYYNSRERKIFNKGLAVVLGRALFEVSVAGAVGTMIEQRRLNPFYHQERRLPHGETGWITKFRTIPEELTQGEMILHGPRDNRARFFGNILRLSGIDEAPQVYEAALAKKGSVIGLRKTTDMHLGILEKADPVLFNRVWYPAYEAGAGDAIMSLGSIQGHAVRERTAETPRNEMLHDLPWIHAGSVAMDLGIIFEAPVVLAAEPLERLRDKLVQKFALPTHFN